MGEIKTPDENDRTDFEKMLDDQKKDEGITIRKRNIFVWHIDFNAFFDKIRRIFS